MPDGALIAQWVGSLAESGSFAMAWVALRRSRVQGFVDDATRMSGLSESELFERLADHERLAELIEIGLETAMRSAAEEKRWLLARVFASSLGESDDARVDDYAMLLRTVAAVEPYHVRLLVEVARPEPVDPRYSETRLEGAKSDGYLAGSLAADQRDLLGPMLSVLEREALVEDSGRGTYGGSPAWSVTRYGHRFMQFLRDGPIQPGNLDRAEFTARIDDRSSSIVVRNLGLATGVLLGVETETFDDGQALLKDSPELPLDLRPAEETSFGVRKVAKSPPYKVDLRWSDSSGPRQRHFLLPSGDAANVDVIDGGTA